MEEAKRDAPKNRSETSSWIEELVILLSRGDITKRDEILWGYTPGECEPFARYLLREVMFREAVLAFLGVKSEAGSPEGIRSKYCAACKKAKKNNCATCTRNIEIIH